MLIKGEERPGSLDLAFFVGTVVDHFRMNIRPPIYESGV